MFWMALFTHFQLDFWMVREKRHIFLGSEPPWTWNQRNLDFKNSQKMRGKIPKGDTWPRDFANIIINILHLEIIGCFTIAFLDSFGTEKEVLLAEVGPNLTEKPMDSTNGFPRTFWCFDEHLTNIFWTPKDVSFTSICWKKSVSISLPMPSKMDIAFQSHKLLFSRSICSFLFALH